MNASYNYADFVKKIHSKEKDYYASHEEPALQLATEPQYESKEKHSIESVLFGADSFPGLPDI